MADSKMSQPQSQHELRIVLVGATGAGKSATGNSFLRREAFKENEDPVSGTIFSQTEEINSIEGFPDIKLSITDTPGLFSTGQDQKKICIQITQFIGQLCPGPHLIIIVVSAGQRVSEEIANTVETLCKIFGEGSKDYMMFLFTKVDQLKTRSNPKPRPIEEWVKKLRQKNKTLDKVLDKCGSRFCGINNEYEFESVENGQQVQRIMTMFLDIIRQNGGSYYTNEELKSIEENIMRPLDQQTGDRSKSRSALGKYLAGVTAGIGGGVTGGALLGTTAVVAETGAAVLSAEAAAGALGGAVFGGGLAATGLVPIAGVGLAGWLLYKGYYKLFVKDVNKEIKQSK